MLFSYARASSCFLDGGLPAMYGATYKLCLQEKITKQANAVD